MARSTRLLVCRTEVGEQLRDRLLAQHRPETINGFVAVAATPHKPERDKHLEYSCCYVNRQTCGLGGFIDPPRRGERSEQAGLGTSTQHCKGPRRVAEIINPPTDVIGIYVGPQILDRNCGPVLGATQPGIERGCQRGGAARAR
jgi:hypothetical protein